MANADTKSVIVQKRKKRRGRSASGKNKKTTPARQASVEPRDQAPPPAWRQQWPRLAAGGAILAVVFGWSYWPTLVELVRAWDREPDYSHGFFVVPLAVYFLWARRDRFPGLEAKWAWPGLGLIGLSIGVRMLGAHYFLGSVDGWSILLLVAGVVCLLGGARVLWWALPSIGFLWFMIPLPFSAERMVSLPLQWVATKLSCWALVSLGQPALSEGNTILINDFQLEVAQACSGLRIFVGIVALAFAYVIIVRRAWWEKVFLLVSVVPIALIANSTRIVVTALLNQHVSGEAAHKFTHDVSGYVMIPFAAGLFAIVLWYLGKLMREVALVDVGAVVRRERS